MFFEKLLLVLALFVITAGAYLLFGTKGQHKFPLEPAHANADLLKQVSKDFSGAVLFDSNRSGTFGIYVQELGADAPKPLVDTELHEMYPDASPDGRLIVYARTNSLEREGPGEVWIANADGTNQRKLADRATFPTFSGDGTKVYFERDRRLVMAVPVEGGEAVEVFPAAHQDWKKYQVIKPRVSPDGSTVYFTTDRGGRWNAYFAEIVSGVSGHVGRGCEPTPFNSGQRAAWITKTHVLSKSGVGIFDKVSQSREKLHDLGPPLGHEYFPTLAQDDTFLLYAACPDGQHDHLKANYQVFIRDLRSNTTVRVNHDTFTNRWPKLLKR